MGTHWYYLTKKNCLTKIIPTSALKTCFFFFFCTKMTKKCLLMGKWYTFRGENLVKFIFLPFWMESILKKKTFSPKRANSCLLEQTPFYKEIDVQAIKPIKQKVIKVVSLVKIDKNIPQKVPLFQNVPCQIKPVPFSNGPRQAKKCLRTCANAQIQGPVVQS